MTRGAKEGVRSKLRAVAAADMALVEDAILLQIGMRR